MVSSGKWYFEVTLNTAGTNTTVGIGQNNITNQYPGQDILSFAQEIDNARKINNDVPVSYGTALTAGQVFMCAIDLDNLKLFFGSQGTWFASSDPVAGTSPAYTLSAGLYCPISRPFGGSAAISINFGQRPFAYTPPTGFVALNTFNLPASTIVKGNTVMDATLYTGTGAAQTIANAAAFYPDYVWAKKRSGTDNNIWVDSNRGATNFLVSNTNGAEATNSAVVSAIGSSGFTLGTDGTINGSGQTNVAWQWNAGSGSTSSNTSGSITSTVSVNAAAGFSIAKFTTQASGVATFGHGLGVAPSYYMVTSRSASSGRNVYHSAIGATKYLQMNTIAAAATDSSLWNNTAPTSTLITIGTAFAGGSTAVCYAWAEIAGFSKFGSYVGNSNADGPFIYLGFRPKFVMFKGSTFDNNWYLVDSSVNAINVAGAGFKPNATDAQIAISTSENAVDFLSNGFKLRNNAAAVAFNNSSGQTFLYMAFAENPFKNSLAR
jgi:hypothetical protein